MWRFGALRLSNRNCRFTVYQLDVTQPKNKLAHNKQTRSQNAMQLLAMGPWLDQDCSMVANFMIVEVDQQSMGTRRYLLGTVLLMEPIDVYPSSYKEQYGTAVTFRNVHTSA